MQLRKTKGLRSYRYFVKVTLYSQDLALGMVHSWHSVKDIDV